MGVVHHLINIFGKKIDRKVIAFDSDDWGNVNLSSNQNIAALNNYGLGFKDDYLKYDNLENENDLYNLFEVLASVKDKANRHAILSPNFITAFPDFPKMRENHFKEYFYTTTLNYLDQINNNSLKHAWKEGMAKDLFIPQLHAREHIDIKRWLYALQNEDNVARFAFDNFYAYIDSEKKSKKKVKINSVFDLDSLDDVYDQENIIKESINHFEKMFNYRPTNFIAPAYTWHQNLEPILFKHGIKYIQTLPIQTQPAPMSSKMYKNIYHYMGRKNKIGQAFIVRNAFFEPTLVRNIDWVDNALYRINLAFKYNQPAVISTHRLNFIGSRDLNNRDTNLNLLKGLLQKIVKNWPEVEFVSTNEVGKLL